MRDLIERAKRTMESKHAVASIGALLAFGLAWGALLWVWYDRKKMVSGMGKVNPTSDIPEEEQCREQAEAALTKNLQGPLWLAIAGALAGFIMLIVAAALPSAREMAGRMAHYGAETRRSVMARIHRATAAPSK